MSLLSLDQIKTLYNDLRGRIEANEEGTFPEMSVGSLISDEKISNNAPYLYRPVLSGVGNRAWQKLVGATIANNQLEKMPTNGQVINGLTFSVDANGVITLSGTPSNGYMTCFGTGTLTANHVYVINNTILANPNNLTPKIGSLNVSQLMKTSGWGIAKPSANIGYNAWGMESLGSADYTGFKFTTQAHDLTLMFGSAIADYAYTLETQTAGSGIAWLKSYGFFGKYAPYDAGSLISTKAEKKKVVGFNVWDEVIEDGAYNSTGGKQATAGYKRSANLIPVMPNTDYYLKVPTTYTNFRVCRYDINGTGINRVAPSYNAVFNTGADVYFITFHIETTTYNNDICINLSKTTGTPKNGDYVAYASQEYDLGSDELRGLFKLDANNNIVADGDIKTADGTITRKYASLEMSDIAIGYNASLAADGIFPFTISGMKTNGGLIAEGYVANTNTSTWVQDDMTIVELSGNVNLRLKNSSFANYTAAQVTAALSGKYLVYELATPTTEQGTPFIDPSIVYPNGTEEYIDTRTVPVPVGNETEYSEDLKGGLETILDTPSANGTYVLKATVSGGVATLGWVAE